MQDCSTRSGGYLGGSTHRGGQVGTGVEQVVLHGSQHSDDIGGKWGARNTPARPDGGAGPVAVGIGDDWGRSATREKSLSPVLPSSPVQIRVRCNGSGANHRGVRFRPVPTVKVSVADRFW